MVYEIYNGKMKVQEDALLARSPIVEGDKELITKFVDSKIAEGITINRATKLSRTLRLIEERYLKGQRFQDPTREDTVRIIAAIEQNSDMKAWTRRDYKLILRMFLSWLGKDSGWIKVNPPKNDLRAEEMLNVDEVNAMIDAANSLRDKALIACLYEGGFRIAELATARIKDVVFDTYGAILIVRGKTGLRRVRLISSVPHLSQWIEAHPLRDDRNAPLWIGTTRHEVLKYDAIRGQLQKIAKRAGIKKNVNPHNFRHSRASYLASHLTESQLEEYLGWQHGSVMPRTYVHLSGRDVDEQLRKLHGLDGEQKKDEPTVKLCPFCKALNAIGQTVCHNCKRPLEMKAEDVISLEDELAALKQQYAAQEEKIREIETLKEEIEEMKAEKSDEEAIYREIESNPKRRIVLKELIAEVLKEKGIE
jgi:integrase/recombinase XerD